MKSILIISDIPRCKEKLRRAIRGMNDAAMVGEGQILSIAIHKAYLLEPDIIMAEQSTISFDGAALAARFESDGLCSRVILLHPDEESPRKTYSQNVLGHLCYSQINTDNLRKLIFSSIGSQLHTASHQGNITSSVAFLRFHFLIGIWAPGISSAELDAKVRDIHSILENMSYSLAIQNKHSVAIWVERGKEELWNHVLEQLSDYFRRDDSHLFIFPNMTREGPIDELRKAYTFKKDIRCFFEPHQRVTILEQIVFPAKVNKESIDTLLADFALALEEGDQQSLNQISYSLFEFHARPSLNMDTYQDIVDRLNACAARFNEQLSNPVTLWRMSTNHTISETLEELLKITRKLLAGAGKEYSSAISNAIYYIRNNYGSDISLADISGHVYLSPSYLSHRFSSEVGTTVVGYLMDVRLKRAKKMLREGCSVSYSGGACGFSSSKYFAKIFKHAIGITPSEYRALNYRN